MMKIRSLLVAFMSAANLMAATPTITGVTAQQRYPWNGLVDIAVTIEGESNDVAKTECSFVATNVATSAGLIITNVVCTGTDANNSTNWTRRFIWNATADVGEVKIDDVALTVKAELKLGGVQLWKDGPYWAECNVGASKPEEYGYYFWWGDTVGYKRVGSSWNAVDGSKTGFSFESGNCPTYGKEVSTLQSLGYIDATGNLVAVHDAATAHIGAPWRMPTSAEIDTLKSNCTTTWIVTNGVYGRLVTGKGDYAAKSIFVPASGYGNGYSPDSTGSSGSFWSSTLVSNDSRYAWRGYFYSSDFYRQGYFRYYGYPVRPLREFAQTTTCGAVTVHAVLDTRTGTRTNSGTMEQIRFSPAWETTADGAVATVSLNGVAVTNATEVGTFKWTPTRNGTYSFTHTVTTNGVVVGEVLTATFLVEGLNPENPVITPASGTTFSTSQTISMTCASDGATIHYTTDGSEPTMESATYKRFRISGKTTVKARAFYENGEGSDTVVAEYALGQCDDPAISLADGTVFEHSNQEVSIAMGDEGTLHYTLDGTEPTAESPVYEGPFTISESTVVKAKVFSDRYFDSQVVTANLTRQWVTVATPVITAASSFTGSKTPVAIACATEGATIRYTLTGSDPNSHSKKYTGPFYVTEGCTVKADALLSDYLNSVVATQTITHVWSIGQTLGKPDHAFTTSGDLGFVRVDDTTAPLGESMKSGAISNCQTSILETVVIGAGTLSFKWKTSCEQDEEYHAWDHAELVVDGAVVSVLDGVTDDWQTVTQAISGTGTHTILWRYCKDDVEKDGEDCLWVCDYAWTSAYTTTQTTAVPVPYAWLSANCPEVVDEYASYEAAAKRTGANPVHTVEDCWVAGLDPNDATAELTAVITMSNNVPCIEWTPNLNATSAQRLYRIYGRESLESGDWEYPANDSHHFFKVQVTMPDGETESDVPGPLLEKELGGVQLWKDGPYWAECNVGASKPEEYGYYFWWGDTVGYTREGGTWTSGYYYSGVTWVSSTGERMSSSPFSSSTCPTYNQSNSSLQSLGYIDSTGNLVAAHDAATAHLGAPWRMPTADEIDALNSNCTTTWITTNGVSGCLVTGKGDYAAKSIFLPAAGSGFGSALFSAGSYGYYWSSTPDSDNSFDAWGLIFNSSYFGRSSCGRCYGWSVRPLRDCAQ